MTLSQRFRRINLVKFSFAKSSEHARFFAIESGAYSMYDPNFGLGIPATMSPENQLRGVFREIVNRKGLFLFNISGVDLRKAREGYSKYQEAEFNSQITEWELFMILINKDYFKSCIFHNGKVQFKKTLLWKSIM